MFRGFILICLALTACDTGKIAEAKDLVRSKLSDPESAQFQNITTRTTKLGNFTVCGQVNSKNRMGGYVGFRDFYVQAGSAYLAPEESVALDLEAQAEQTVEVLQFGNRHLAACIIQ